MRKLFQIFLDFIAPFNCEFCEKYDLFSARISICKDCLKRGLKESAVNSAKPRCPICITDLMDTECGYCNSRNVFFSRLYAIRIKGEFERKIIQKVKFEKCPNLSNFFRIGLRKIVFNFKIKNYSNIVIVPSNKQTLRNRPIPVCYPITKFIQKQLKINTISPFQKISTELQSGKNFRDRFIHAQKAFQLKEKFRKELNGNYLLIDDVFTTGATINEMSKILLLNGAKVVDVLVLVKGKS